MRNRLKLLHPDASVEGFAVAVYCVPVGERYIEVAKKTKVGEATGEGNASGVLVGMKVGVFNGVGVAGVTMAVCVWKTEATNVPTL